MIQNELRPFWAKFINFDAKLGFGLILLVCIPRFLMVLNANVTQQYGPIALIMIISAVIPFVLLSKYGRNLIGIIKPTRLSQIVFAFLIGIMLSMIMYIIGDVMYGDTYNNWYTYIGKTYNLPQNISNQDRNIYFIIFATTGMIFSPIGEELFFRGIVHSSLTKQFGDSKASIIDSLAFAITHISHFGLIYIFHQWSFLWLPTMIWTMFIFFLGLVFFYFKKTSGSILGAIICHSGFNLGMTYAIFYLL